MCFNNRGIHRIAEEPIECYKVMRVYSTAYYYRDIVPTELLAVRDTFILNSLLFPNKEPYNIGDVIVASVKKPLNELDGRRHLNAEVVHSYGTENIKRFLDSYFGVGYVTTTETVTDVGCLRMGKAVVRCEIPKGTAYWYDDLCDEYASLEVVIKEIIRMR